MALTTTTVNPTLEPFPYAGMPERQRGQTPIPSREMRCYTRDKSITAGGAGNEQRLVVQLDLPPNYAYVLVDLSCMLGLAGSINWDAVIQGYLQDGLTTVKSRIPMELFSHGITEYTAAGSERRVWIPEDIPRATLIPSVAGEQVRLHLETINSTQNDGAASFTFYARFLEFTIEQAHHWQVNTPEPVR